MTLEEKEKVMKTLGKQLGLRKQLGLGLLTVLVLVLSACGGAPAVAPGFSL